MGNYALGFREIDWTLAAVCGGKGAHLGELARIKGITVPPGFCVTTDAFRRILAEDPSIENRLDVLTRLHPDDREAIRTISAGVRRAVERTPIPDDLAVAITGALTRFGRRAVCAVRSSATAEDSPTASFAGQHDTYLNVVGPAAILRHVRRCWASLFTERAVAYRLRNGFDLRKAQMAVVVQQMVAPEAAGVLFTADPVTSNRKITSIEASFGLGEALVNGLVNADVYKVRDGEIVEKVLARKRLAVHASPAGGTREQAIGPGRQEEPALTDAQAVRLAQLGRRIEARFGHPQDVEWCLVDDGFRIVQSRPITTLFPIPLVEDEERHVFVSVGHQQMMTDPIKPLGISVWQLTAYRPMYHAGGRLFVDVTRELASPASREALLEGLGQSDPLTGDALRRIVDRGDFIPTIPNEASGGPPAGRAPAPIETDPAIVAELIRRSEASLADLKRDIERKSGEALLDFIVADIQELKRIVFGPQSQQVIRAGMEATWWLNERLQEWLGENCAADMLAQSVPYNVTSEMALALLDVADVIRPHPEVVAYLEQVEGDDFLDEVVELAGGREAREAIVAYLDRYGMRCTGEIDISRPRWSERPGTLVPVILGNIRNFEPGAGKRRFEQGRQDAWNKEQELLQRLRDLPDGERKAAETKRMIDRVRTFTGYREYPKYIIVNRYFVYRQALLQESGRLLQPHLPGDREDIFFLNFDELRESVRTQQLDDQLIAMRKDRFRSCQSLVPPRVLTSDGEVIAGTYRRNDLPSGVLVGLPVSAGVIEGRARVVRNLAEGDFAPGDILVTAYTDPAWSPLFIAIKGLVTEVGGLMTHGSVIAREFGLPAVVGVERATELIHNGQRIRVHGTEGYVEILPRQSSG